MFFFFDVSCSVGWWGGGNDSPHSRNTKLQHATQIWIIADIRVRFYSTLVNVAVKCWQKEMDILCHQFKILKPSIHQWRTAAISWLELTSLHFPTFDSVQKHLRNHVVDELFSILPPLSPQTQSRKTLALSMKKLPFTAKTVYTDWDELSDSFYIPLVSKKFHFETLCLRAKRMLPIHYNLNFSDQPLSFRHNFTNYTFYFLLWRSYNNHIQWL